MKVSIDVQCLQSASSKRGIGDYTRSFLASFIDETETEIVFLLNNLEPLEQDLYDFLTEFTQKVKFVFFTPLTLKPSNYAERIEFEKLNMILYTETIDSLQVDLHLIMSFFEGFNNSMYCGIDKERETNTKFAVIIYDFIPHLNPTDYLSESRYQIFYGEKIQQLKNFDLFLSISDKVAKDIIKVLEVEADKIVTILGGPRLKIGSTPRKTTDRINFLFVGGSEPRKNLENVIAAFELLSKESVYNKMGLTVIGPTKIEHKLRVENVKGITYDYLPEKDFEQIWRDSDCILIPTIDEGLNLVLLDSLATGKNVILSEIPTHREIISEHFEGYFEKHSAIALKNRISNVLNEDHEIGKQNVFQYQLPENYNWKTVAEKAYVGMEKLIHKKQSRRIVDSKILVVTPWPPSKTGIANYVRNFLNDIKVGKKVDILTDLSNFKKEDKNFEFITLQGLIENYSNYDHVVYHLGNSFFHDFMLDVVHAFPGIVVMHDQKLKLWMSYLQNYAQRGKYESQNIYESHGYLALMNQSSESVKDKFNQDLLSRNFLHSATTVVVHSEYARTLIISNFPEITEKIIISPMYTPLKDLRNE
jgi:glycosyltransferase involved in cell wall biosynthesis